MHSGGSKRTTERQAAIASAMRTVTTEQAGMAALAEALNGGLAEPFARAVEVLSALTGRVIVTGVGKSGHIGSKIAATLASTGTPAYFVHPSEANHGDLGMITKDDVIIAISWSGESSELKGIVSYARRFSIPLIAITAGETSALAREADIVLACPRRPKPVRTGWRRPLRPCCNWRSATRSLWRCSRRGASPPIISGSFHPGGQLGANLTHVGEIMHSGDEMPVVPLGTKMPEAVMVLSKKRFGCVCVIDGEGQLVGIVTDGDLARNLHRNMSEMAVEDIMTRQPKTVKRQTIAGAAMGLLNDHHISALIVVDGRHAGRRSCISMICCGSARRERSMSVCDASGNLGPRSQARSGRLDDQFEVGGDRRLDAHLRAGRQIGAANAPHRVADADTAAAVLDRLGQRRDLADHLLAAPVEKRLVGVAAAATHQPVAGIGSDHGQYQEDQDLHLPDPEAHVP